MSELTPKQVVAELDKYIIGQDDAKREVAIALRTDTEGACSRKILRKRSLLRTSS